MSMISELVDSLRTEAKSMGTYGTDYMATLLMRSADTIEMLSEKAREPKRGEWIGEGDGYADGGIVYDTWYCSNCDHCEEGEELALPNYCPNCGADMRKGADDDTD